MLGFRFAAAATLTLVLSASVNGQPDPVIDGLFDDWKGVAPVYSDPQGDGAAIDLGRVWMRNDDQFVYLSFEMGESILLNSENDLTLGLDTDYDQSTGLSFASIGAELIWKFGERIGSFRSGGSTLDVAFQDIGLASAPTVTSSVFELTLRLDAQPRRLGELFPSDTVRLAISDGSLGDRLPDAGDEAVFVIDRSVEERFFDIEIGRQEASDFRVLSWNVLQDGLFEANRFSAFQRILRAIGPDVIVFSEIFSHSATQVLSRMNELIPLSSGEQWFASAAPSSVVLVSKTPIIQTLDVDPRGRAGGFLIGRPPGFERDVFVVGAHLFCCDADANRQLQVDHIMATIRDARTDGTLPTLTPLIIAGDMNFVGDRRQPLTLIEGSIVNTWLEPSFDPDWDGTSLADAVPQTTGVPQTYTWISPEAAQNRQFSPGRLDYIIYSDAVLSKGNSFALYSREFAFNNPEGLNLTDSGVASDHLPIVADFAPISTTSNEIFTAREAVESEIEVYPNPALRTVNVQVSSDRTGSGELELFDALGRRMSSHELSFSIGGTFQTVIDISRLPAGLYFVVVDVAGWTVKRGFVKAHVTD